ncbi:hypothetical protein [Niveibacterium sp. SC-1]|uniref:hypothetical protein n=1 Tax=Niveibacterium sp. SC-1 TaxID=3135646 RepID=UPI0031204C79
MRPVVTPTVTPTHRLPVREALAATGLLLLALLIGYVADLGMDAWQAARGSREPIISAALSEQDLQHLIALQPRAQAVEATADSAAGLESDTGLRHLLIFYPELLSEPVPEHLSAFATADETATRGLSI